MLYDGEIHSRELGGILQALARRDGPEPVETKEYRGRVDEIPDVVRDVAEDQPDAVLYAGIAGPGTGRILAQIDSLLPGVPVYTTYGMLARDPEVPIPAAPASVDTFGPIPPESELPRRGQAPARPPARDRGRGRGPPRGAVRLRGDAPGDRRHPRGAAPTGPASSTEALRIRERRRSPLGPYRVRATGEVETTSFALYTLRDGRFTFDRMLE